MCIVKMINEPYYRLSDLKNEICYMSRPDHCTQGIFGATGVLCNPDRERLDKTNKEMYRAMVDTKREFLQMEGRQLIHIMVSLDKEEMAKATEDELAMIACEVGMHFFNEYQCVYGVHDNEDFMHFHMTINTVSYIDGHKLSIPQGFWEHVKVFINNKLCTNFNITISELEIF